MGDMLRLKAPHGRKLFSWCEYFDEFPPPSTHYSLAKYWGVNLDTRAQLPRARHRSYWPRSAQRKMSRLCFMFCVTGQKFELETRISVIMSSQDVVSICWEVILRLQRIWPIKVAGIVAGKCWCLTFDYSKLCGIVFPKIFEFASEDRTVSVRPIRGSEETSRNPHQDQQDLGCFKPDPGPSDVLSVSQYFVWAEQQGGGSGNDA